jgi:ubiquinone/menaquinone biosynthesis C-methylase UbiE
LLQRILEPEVMDSSEEARDYDAMDHAQVNQLFVADLLEQRRDLSTVLDVGTGTAQIPIALCTRHATARVTAIDMAEHMLSLGRANVERAGFSDRVRLERIDAKRMPFEAASFDVVMSNSIVHHIPEPFAVLSEMARVIKRGGLLFVRDLLRPVSEATLADFVRTYAGDADAHQQKMFADSLHAALTLEEMQALVKRLGFDEATVKQTSDRHWTWTANR